MGQKFLPKISRPSLAINIPPALSTQCHQNTQEKE
jgi:hypothetical protein